MTSFLKRLLNHSPAKPKVDRGDDPVDERGSYSESVSFSRSLSISPSAETFDASSEPPDDGDVFERAAHSTNRFVDAYRTVITSNMRVDFIVCEYCGQRNLPLYLYCGQCGAPL